MEERICFVRLLILWLSVISVAAENHHRIRAEVTAGENGDDGNDAPNNVPHLGSVLAFPPLKNVESVQGVGDGRTSVEEATVRSVVGDRSDANTPLTHHHVDQLMAVLKPTKRVKKILPPFEGKRQTSLNKRNASKNGANPKKSNVEPEAVVEQKENNLKKESKFESLKKSFINVNGENKKKSDKKFSDLSEKTGSETEIFKNENLKVFPDETDGESTLTSSIATTQSSEEAVAGGSETEIQGIRLVPNDREEFQEDVAEESEEDEDEETVGKRNLVLEKSIWDLLRERKGLEGREPNIFNESKSETMTTTTTMASGGIDALDDPAGNVVVSGPKVESKTEKTRVESSKVDKHEVPSSYALPLLNTNKGDRGSRGEKQEKENNRTDVWIKNTEEMVRLLRLTREEYPEDEVFVDVVINDRWEDNEKTQRPSTWFLFLLAGNLTIIQLRRNDFTKYLRVNLAARLSMEYDDVRVNMVVLIPPKILVNVTVFAPKETGKPEKNNSDNKRERSLFKMTETNATLLELSGEEYHVIRFFSVDSLKPEAHKRVKSFAKGTFLEDVEFVFYTFLGSCCACALILLLLVSVNKYFRKVTDLDWPWQDLGSATWSAATRTDFNRTSPAVVFAEGRDVVGSRPPPIAASTSSWTELGPSCRSVLPSPDDCVSTISSCKTKLRLYDCDADSLVFPTSSFENQVRRPGTSDNSTSGNDLDPLDVRNRSDRSSDQDYPIFPN